jgi:hypothetical protein
MKTLRISFGQRLFLAAGLSIALFILAGGRLHVAPGALMSTARGLSGLGGSSSGSDSTASSSASASSGEAPPPAPPPPLPDIHVEWPALLPAPTSTYPQYQSLLTIVKNWSPDDPDLPPRFTETLMHFNYSDPVERSYAEKFRDAEVPFKVYGVPEFNAVAGLWTDDYLQKSLVGKEQHVEKSDTNHFMYWTPRGKPDPEYEPPTEFITMSFEEWLKIAKSADTSKQRNDTVHYYFMTSAPPRDNKKSFISRDLSLFSTETNNFFITNVPANKGIQCRFGMRGIIAEAHFDSGRNMVAMLKGAKRYILNPPQACKQLGIISDTKHPSYRHSVIDWSDIQQAESRGFASVQGIDTIVRTGEVLYIPSYWLHYIISTRYSIQCNSRSGAPPNGQGQTDIEECFGPEFTYVAGALGFRVNPHTDPLF